MGIYLNPQNTLFQNMVNSTIYVDHTLLIEHTNQIINTKNNKLCILRPRRFGKSIDANMLVAYYSKGCDSSSIFDKLKISQTESYHDHLNQHHVIHINMQDFLSMASSVDEMIKLLTEEIIDELEEYFQIENKRNILALYLSKILSKTNEQFIFIIDEWDCIFREYSENKDAQKQYLDFLRNLFKDKSYVELVYMTGILPIKKYGTHSALNMFDEISMVDPGLLTQFMGFTEQEVEDLCLKYNMDYEKMKDCYDGYKMTDDLSVYNHRSVVYALMDRKYENYRSATETYEALKVYIDMNYDGLKDDVLTLLIHLGYNSSNQTCYIPNKEVVDSFANSIRSSD